MHKRAFLFSALLMLLTCCCPCKHLSTSTADSTTVKIVERIVNIRDTVFVELPEERVDNTTADTTSRLETSYAVSTAEVQDGVLHHSLWNKTSPVGVAVNLDFKVQDIEKERIFTVNEVVEVPAKLTWWQETQIKGFRMLSLIVGLFLCIKFRKPILSLLS